MVLVLYVPVLHRGYIELFKKYKGKTNALYLLDDEIVADFSLTAREIRSIPVDKMYELLAGLNYFPVKIVTKQTLAELSRNNETIVLANDHISDQLEKDYFAQHKVIRETVFLRYDEKTVQNARHEVGFDGEITEDAFHQEVMKKLGFEKEKSGDLFLQVAAAIITDSGIVALDHNHRVPTPHSMAILGDPRNFMTYGTDTHQRATVHAEQACIAHCARHGIKTEGAEMYVTTFPCPDCVNVIAEAGIKKIYFRDGYSQLSSQDVLKLHDIKIAKVLP